MIVPEYVPGSWHAVVAGGVVALLSPATRPEVVRAVWDAVPTGGGLADQLQVLLTGGIVGLQPFALVDLSGGSVHLALRGEVEVEVRGADGTEVLRSGEVTTWSERVVAGASDVLVRVAGTVWETDGALPVLSGVVRASAVRVVLVPGAGEAVLPAPDAGAAVVPVLEAELEPALPVRVEDTAPEPEPEPEPSVEGLIDHVPAGWLVPDASALDAPSGPDVWGLEHDPTRAAVVAEAESVLGAGVLGAGPLGAGPLGEIEDTGVPDDHDGLTILSSDLQSIRDQLPSWAGDEVPGPFRAVAPQVAAPAKIVLSTGQIVTIDRTVLLGRSPQATRVSNRELPRLVTLASPQQDISRTHAEVRAEGEDVLVTDLHSTNGLLVARPGERARRLHPGEATAVADGEVVDMGDGVTFTVERGA